MKLQDVKLALKRQTFEAAEVTSSRFNICTLCSQNDFSCCDQLNFVASKLWSYCQSSNSCYFVIICKLTCSSDLCSYVLLILYFSAAKTDFTSSRLAILCPVIWCVVFKSVIFSQPRQTDRQRDGARADGRTGKTCNVAYTRTAAQKFSLCGHR